MNFSYFLYVYCFLILKHVKIQYLGLHTLSAICKSLRSKNETIELDFYIKHMLQKYSIMLISFRLDYINCVTKNDL